LTILADIRKKNTKERLDTYYIDLCRFDQDKFKRKERTWSGFNFKTSKFPNYIIEKHSKYKGQHDDFEDLDFCMKNTNSICINKHENLYSKGFIIDIQFYGECISPWICMDEHNYSKTTRFKIINLGRSSEHKSKNKYKEKVNHKEPILKKSKSV
jgi:hypothetical protein